jgi:hypothetical protein
MKLTFEQLENELSSLDKDYLKVMIFNLLVKGNLKYDELSELYVRYLERTRKDNRDLITELAVSLVQHRNPKIVGGNKKDKKEFMDNKAINAIKRTKLFPENAGI